jgi:hypothetical protein
MEGTNVHIRANNNSKAGRIGYSVRRENGGQQYLLGRIFYGSFSKSISYTIIDARKRAEYEAKVLLARYSAETSDVCRCC